jgi:hypothetical protein
MGLTPGTRLGPYEVVAAIGAGGMGEVYRATDTTLGRQVAFESGAVLLEPLAGKYQPTRRRGVNHETQRDRCQFSDSRVLDGSSGAGANPEHEPNHWRVEGQC